MRSSHRNPSSLPSSRNPGQSRRSAHADRVRSGDPREDRSVHLPVPQAAV